MAGLAEVDQRVYRAMLSDPLAGVQELSESLGLPEQGVRSSLDALARVALLTPDEQDPLRLRPASPRVGVGRLLREAQESLEQQTRTVNDLWVLMHAAIAESEAHRAAESLVMLTSVDQVRTRLEELSLTAKVECLSLNPGRAHEPDAMAASKPVNQQVLERGIAIRALYQESFVHDHGTLAYAQWMGELGGEVHTIAHVPWKLVLVDREVALVPTRLDDPSAGAMEVRNPVLVAILLAYFENLWASSRPFSAPSRKRDHGVTDPVTKCLLDLLASGYTDAAAARKLGLSDRTVRRLMASVMEELGAASRFQAAVEAQRRGWL